MGSSSGKEECEDMSQQESKSKSRKRKRVPESENASTAIFEAVQQIADNKAVWRANTNGGYQDVMYSIYSVLAALFTHQIVPYPSNAYEEYTLSNCVVFTMTLSKALRKTVVEIKESRDPKMITGYSGKKVLCYGNWGICPHHLKHTQISEGGVNWKIADVSNECLNFAEDASRFGDYALLSTVFPEVLSPVVSTSVDQNAVDPALQSSIAALRGRCLHGASRGGEKSLVKVLLAAKADVNAVNQNRSTSLMWASENGHLEVVKVLLAANADVNAVNQNPSTSLIYASVHGHAEVVKVLLAANADVNAVGHNDSTSLMLASMNGRLEVVKVLLAANADVNAVS